MIFADVCRIPYIAALSMAVVVKYRINRHVSGENSSEEGPLLEDDDDAPLLDS